MTLRAEIHDALDEITPPAPQLEFRISELLRDSARDKTVVLHPGGRAPWPKRFRGVVTLVAAALVVVLIGGLILEGRLLRNTNAPAPAINQTELKRLEARPKHFPVVKSGDPCPISPLSDTSAHGPVPLVFGTGPVYSGPLTSDLSITSWGRWMIWSTQVDTTQASGLILVRAMDLQAGEMVAFTKYPFTAVGEPGAGIPAGRVTGSQVVHGVTVQLHPELVIDTSRIYVGTKESDWPIYKSYMGYPKAAKGCIGFQIDGGNFTELLVLGA
jgi:hypothetical protein